MDARIYNPLEEFDVKFKSLHLENTKKHFEELVTKSAVNVEENRKTVKEHADLEASLKKLNKKYNWLRFLRVLACITVILIPLVIFLLTPKIKALRTQIEQSGDKLKELYDLAVRQMQPLNDLFTDSDALRIIEQTIPLLDFEGCLSAEQENDMNANYDFGDSDDKDQSTLDVLAGRYNGNPFVFERRLIHTLGEYTYHGTKVISWTERYRGSDGKYHTRIRTQTLHAYVTKPKPYYSNQVLLNYCSQAGERLSFTRDATNLDDKSEREIERYVKRGAKKLKKLTDEAIAKNEDFTSMSNTDFEVMFDALDRTDEVQFRALFTPLAQTNMVDLIRSQKGYGDDFNFIKCKRTNKIITEHSQGRVITLTPSEFYSHSFDVIKENFINKNAEYFKAVYFDFAPVWAIPAYQDRPVHSLEPLPDSWQKYSYKECEALSNLINPNQVVHPNTKTPAILNTTFAGTSGKVDSICVTASSYDVIPKVDFVSVLGGDGYWHSVAVPWDCYVPLSKSSSFSVAPEELAKDKNIMAKRKQLCIFN